MKREILIVLLLAGSVLALSAKGSSQDDDTPFYGRGPGMMGGYRYSEEDFAKLQEEREAARAEFLESLETLSVSGPLSLVNGELPYIEKEGIKYIIMAPWYDLSGMKLENGMDVTVEGYKMPGRPLQWDDSEIILMATKAVVNGEEITIEHDGYGMGFPSGHFGGGWDGPRGGRGGMMGPRF